MRMSLAAQGNIDRAVEQLLFLFRFIDIAHDILGHQQVFFLITPFTLIYLHRQRQPFY